MEKEGTGIIDEMKDVINTIKLAKKIRNNFGWDYVIAYLFDKYILAFWTVIAIKWGIIIAYLKIRGVI